MTVEQLIAILQQFSPKATVSLDPWIELDEREVMSVSDDSKGNVQLHNFDINEQEKPKYRCEVLQVIDLRDGRVRQELIASIDPKPPEGASYKISNGQLLIDGEPQPAIITHCKPGYTGGWVHRNMTTNQITGQITLYGSEPYHS